jgi:hypothetical protein
MMQMQGSENVHQHQRDDQQGSGEDAIVPCTRHVQSDHVMHLQNSAPLDYTAPTTFHMRTIWNKYGFHIIFSMSISQIGHETFHLAWRMVVIILMVEGVAVSSLQTWQSSFGLLFSRICSSPMAYTINKLHRTVATPKKSSMLTKTASRILTDEKPGVTQYQKKYRSCLGLE